MQDRYLAFLGNDISRSCKVATEISMASTYYANQSIVVQVDEINNRLMNRTSPIITRVGRKYKHKAI
jgi:hypothetical protein